MTLRREKLEKFYNSRKFVRKEAGEKNLSLENSLSLGHEKKFALSSLRRSWSTSNLQLHVYLEN